MAIFAEVQSALLRGTCLIRSTFTLVFTGVVVQSQKEKSKKTNFVLDYLSLHITTEHSSSQKAIKSSLMYRPCTD